MNLEEDGYIILRGFFSRQVAEHLGSLVIEEKESGSMFYNDAQVEKAFFKYNLPILRAFHLHETERVSRLCNKALVPTYCYTRVYEKESELLSHRDRKECEFSVTIHLQGDYPWDFFIENKHTGQEVGILLEPGDAVIYKGCEVSHFRKPFLGTWYVQSFFHYVDETASLETNQRLEISSVPTFTNQTIPYVRAYTMSLDVLDIQSLGTISSFTPYLEYFGCTQSEVIHEQNGWKELQENLTQRILHTLCSYFAEHRLKKSLNGSHDLLQIEKNIHIDYFYQDIPPFQVHTLYILSGACKVSFVGFKKNILLQERDLLVIPVCYAYSYQLSTIEKNCKLLRSFF